MKTIHKLILSATVLFALSTMAVAQPRLKATRLEAGALQQSPWIVESGQHRAPRHIELTGNERILGTYITDDIADQGSGLPTYPGTMKVATFLPTEFIQKFNGCEITTIRFGLPVAVTVNSVFIYAVNDDGSIGDLLVNSSMPSQAYMGWNEVIIAPAFTIDTNREGFGGYLLGYEYEQVDTKVGASYTQDCYPLSFVRKGIIYRTYMNSDGQWKDIDATSLGNLSIQCIARNSNGYPQKDIVLSPITIDGTLKQAGNDLAYSFRMENFGSQDISDYAVSINLDNEPLATLNGSLASMTSETISRQLTLPATTASGSHTLTAAVRLIEGAAPTERTEDDITSKAFAVYGDADVQPRQQFVVENFTSTADVYTANADAILKAMLSNHDDIAIVNIHGNAQAGQDDPLHIAVCDDVQRLLDQQVWPSAAFNRVYLGEQPARGYYGLTANLAYDTRYANQMATEFYQKMSGSIPALAKLSAQAVAVDDQLTVTVSGEGSATMRELLEPTASITVYLIEDGVVSPQQTASGRVEDYCHDHVLRTALTNFRGDALQWTDAQHFDNTFSLTLDPQWNAEQMSVVAFVHLNADALNPGNSLMGISNAVTQKLTVTSGIATHPTSQPSLHTSYYTPDGRSINALVRGMNILRMSDGTTRKVIIR